jgi:hypothetical protein
MFSGKCFGGSAFFGGIRAKRRQPCFQTDDMRVDAKIPGFKASTRANTAGEEAGSTGDLVHKK